MARPTTYFIRTKINIDIEDPETNERMKELEVLKIFPYVYIPYKVTHNFYETPAVKEACNVLTFAEIKQPKAIIDFAGSQKLPPEIGCFFTITFKRLPTQQIKKKIRLLASPLDTHYDTIAARLFDIKEWDINNINYEMEQVLGPKERITFKTGIV